ncbi:SDR family NAD(P)-dependent oxidoreductase [Microbacterium sp. JZ37]|uniref:SDR family NAD(P)-dependent oxidoreductase n=1 Tax=Microbacterium sp. JZ37 TaxID=2654193 RepID=UPI002B4A3ED1|nr:SDR family NAD(P)-dependent oxidoreductase [Microbacterium sp. JZ37]WRH18736.1 SDR family NAD(P)-dependent oxidoreductase [Microbacterium sp. JZ37]
MTGRILVTGGFTGLGRELTRELSSRGESVIAAGRDARRCPPFARVVPLELDLASLGSIASAVERVREVVEDGLSGIVCNAAVQVVDGVRRSAEGHELTFATNHLGHFALVTRLLESVRDGGTVTIVSSGTHAGPQGAFGFPGPRWRPPALLADPREQDPSPRAGRVRYATSKLANLYFAYELARREPRLRVRAFDPGLMPATGLARDYPVLVRGAYRLLAPAIAALVPGVRTPASAARHLARLVCDAADAQTGAYVVGGRVARSSEESYDRERASELWRFSEAVVSSG